jgi:hypothetical protein
MTDRRRTLGVVLLLAVIYTALGVAASTVGATAASARIKLLARWTTFVLSGAFYVAHVIRERARGTAVMPTARHSALAAALGGLGLALAANLHELTAGAGYRPRLLVALVVWPILTGGTAFLGATVLAALVAPRPAARPGRAS